MPYLKRSFTYKDEDKVLKTLRQGDYIEDLGKLPSFVQTLLKNGNYLTDEEVQGAKPVKSEEKKPLPVKLSEETTVQTIKLDIKKEESPKKTSENKPLNVNVVNQQGKSHSLNKANPTNKESIKAVKGSDIKVADSPLMKEEKSEKVESKKSESKKEEKSEKVEKPVEQKKPDIIIPVSKKEEEIETVSTKETANLVQNKNPKARPQGKRNIQKENK